MRTAAPVFCIARAQHSIADPDDAACTHDRTGDIARSKIKKKTPKQKPLLLTKKAVPAEPPSGDFVLDNALKMAGKRTAPWETS